jgi:HUS1 checkpoint protein
LAVVRRGEGSIKRHDRRSAGMRFRTAITNVPLLHSELLPQCFHWVNFLLLISAVEIVKSLSSLAKVCIIRLSPEKVYFIVPGNEGRDGVQVWS